MKRALLKKPLCVAFSVILAIGSCPYLPATAFAESTADGASVVKEEAAGSASTGTSTSEGDAANGDGQSSEAAGQDAAAGGSSSEAPSTEPDAEEQPAASTSDSTEATTTLLPEVSIAEATSVSSSSTTYDFSSEDTDYRAKSPRSSTVYYVSGTTSSHNLEIQGGTAQDPIEVHLQNLTIDASGQEWAAINIVEGSYVSLVIDGTVHLTGGTERNGILSHDWGYAGIRTAGSTVAISGVGNLEVQGGDDSGADGGAGIGGNREEPSGTIEIWGSPTIVATGGGEAAGIGEGDEAKEGTSAVTILSGDVTARGGDKAAGIGTGKDAANKGMSITISSGTVDARSTSSDAAGIGSGSDSDMSSITILGGTVTAVAAGENGAGVGAAWGGDVDAIKISMQSGSLTATATNDGAGIGAADGTPADGGDVQTIDIAIGGTASITASSGEDGAGIGSSVGGTAHSVSVIASGTSTITATGGAESAGIGSSHGNDQDSLVVGAGDGATVTAQGGSNGAGVGGGSGSGGNITVNMSGGTLVAKGGTQGAGIGSGNSDSKDITITGRGTVSATSGGSAAGIGASNGGVSGAITVKGDGPDLLTINADATTKVDTDHGAGAGIGSAQGDGGDIYLEGATINAKSRSGRAAIGTGDGEDGWGTGGSIDSITIKNCSVTADSGAGSKASWACAVGSSQKATVKNITIEDSTYTGGAIGAGYGGDMESIKISNSNVKATAKPHESNDPHSPGAGIGPGERGSIDSIVIENSTVEASGTGGGPGIGAPGRVHLDATLTDGSGEVKSIVITDGTVTATGSVGSTSQRLVNGEKLTYYSAGGAGIGTGSGAKAGTIDIERSTVTATGGSGNEVGAAGIGSGSWGDTEAITITDSTITANGGATSAGIGTGGIDEDYFVPYGISGMIKKAFNEAIHTGPITITNSKVTATGGSGSAGIGAGQNADMQGAIDIVDSEVDATGGSQGAGIGGSVQTVTGAGDTAVLQPINISGKSKVTATGGKYAAGIGAGQDSGAKQINISLDTERDADGFVYYVRAQGGELAAGIGTGAGSGDNGVDGNFNTSVKVTGGYVYAKGGSGDKGGAGIGTGAFKSGLDPQYPQSNMGLIMFEVTGGFVEAEGGSSTAADIGVGDGIPQASIATENIWSVSGGTVIADTWTQQNPQITGGSVSANLTHATSGGARVYRTTLKMTSPYAHVNASSILPSPMVEYGTNDLYSDANQHLYLYLRQYDSNQASLKLNYVGADATKYDYAGTVMDDGSGWLKMQRTVSFKKPTDPIYAGDSFTMALDDDDASLAGATWTFEGGGVVTADGDQPSTVSPGAVGSFTANMTGSYTVTATAADVPSVDPELYWDGVQAVYADHVYMTRATLTFTQDPSKVFDGQPVEDPSVSTNSYGTVVYTYLDANGTELAGAPSDAGKYTVRASLAENSYYSAATAEESFTIEPAATAVELSATVDGTDATLDAKVDGLLSSDGSVTFTDANGQQLGYAPVVQADDGSYHATYTYHAVPAGDYTITATYAPSSGNYQQSTATRTFNKDKIARTLSLDKDVLSFTYGDEGSVFSATASATSGDESWTADVVWDQLVQYGDPTAELTGGNGSWTVTPTATGAQRIQVTVHDNTGVYEDAVAYVTVNVSRAPLTVRSFAVDTQGNEVDRATYGSLDGISWQLAYDGFVNGDTAEDFTNGHGTLEATPLNPALNAGTYDIAILRHGTSITLNGQTYRDVFVSRNYSITYETGSFAVDPAALTVTTPSASKEYDGTPLTAADGATIEGLVAGETATLKVTGSQTVVGRSPNTYQIAWDGTARESNYEVVSESLGILTVTVTTPGPDGGDGQGPSGSGSSGTAEGSTGSSRPTFGAGLILPATGDAPLGGVAAIAVAGALAVAWAAFRRTRKSKR